MSCKSAIDNEGISEVEQDQVEWMAASRKRVHTAFLGSYGYRWVLRMEKKA